MSRFRAIIKFWDKMYTPGIPKLTLIFGFDEELTEIFEVEDKAQFPKSQYRVEEKSFFGKVSMVFNLE